MEEGSILLYDGSCGFCHAAVRFVLRHERKQTLRFAPLQGPFARSLISGHPELADIDSVVWVEQDEEGEAHLSVYSEALLQTARYLGGAWHLFRVFALVPRKLRDAAYRLFARHRFRWFGRLEQCLIPHAEHQHRFLEHAFDE